MSEIGKPDRTATSGTATGMAFTEALTAAIDAWAEAHHIDRSDAIRRLIQIGLRAAPTVKERPSVQEKTFEIEDEAVGRIRALLDPSLPSEERERRIRRLIEGPPEFTGDRRDLPKHDKQR